MTRRLAREFDPPPLYYGFGGQRTCRQREIDIIVRRKNCEAFAHP